MKTLFFGGKILTMAFPLYADAVLVENGIITALGTKSELESAGPDKLINLNGMTMIPSFIDSHSHFLQAAGALMQVSLNGVKSVNEIREKIKEYVDKNKIAPGMWITARDYDNTLLPYEKNPGLSELDKIAPQNPLVIHHKSGHMGLFNSAALNILGVNDNKKRNGDGKIEKDSDGLTGYMEEDAFFHYLKKLPEPDSSMMLSAVKKAQKKYFSYGITSIQEGMFVSQMIPAYKNILKSDILKADLTAYCEPASLQNVKNSFSEHIGKFKDNFRVKGLKIFLDGSPQGKTAWMRKPYENSGDYCGYAAMTDNQVLSALELAAKENMQILAHCNGDAASEQFLSCLYKTERKYTDFKELRPVIIHGQLIGIDQLLKVSELKALISFFPAHVYYWGDVHIRNFSMERAAKISPCASAMKLNIPITLHQDSPVIEPNMIETIWCAASRLTKSGRHLGRQEQISVYNALRAVTINAAYQYGEEQNKGSIATGKTADLTVLNENPLQTPKDRLLEIKVVQTYKNGECVYENNKH